MTVLEVLKGARAKIAQGWTQGALAQDATGAEEDPSHEDAVCWCAQGAIIAAADNAVAVDAAMTLLAAQTGSDHADPDFAVPEWNDTWGRTQIEILGGFDRAIAAEEARQ